MTNIDFESWAEYLGDAPLAMAMLDRVVDGATIVKLKGKSYRVHRGAKNRPTSDPTRLYHLSIRPHLSRRATPSGPLLTRETGPLFDRDQQALALVEPFPDAQQGPLTQLAVAGADGREDAAGDGALEEPPQSAGGQAEPSDFVGEPDAESPPATAPCLAVAAKDPPGATVFRCGLLSSNP